MNDLASAPQMTITAETPIAAVIATMQYLVGFGLSRWHFVEQDLTMIYLSLVCAENAPIDGAYATFTNIRTVDSKIDCVRKTLAQVLYQDEFTDFRTAANTKLNRIRTVNEKRNDIAHGLATTLLEDGEQVPYFLPYYNLPGHFRERSYIDNKVATSIIKRQPKLDLAHLRTLVEGLKEGVDLSRELLDDLLALYADKRANLLAATRMTLECGLPHDWTRPSLPQPEENPAK